MCPKNSKTPIFLIGGICFVIILVAICGVTLINNINLSNIIRLNEKVASDSMSTSNQQHQQYDDDDDGENGGYAEGDYGAQRQSVNSAVEAAVESINADADERLSKYAQSHPKNIYRFDKETGMMTEHQQSNKTKDHAPEHIGNGMSSFAPFGLWPSAKIVDNERNIDTLQIQEINAISSDASKSATIHGEKLTHETAVIQRPASGGVVVAPAASVDSTTYSASVSISPTTTSTNFTRNVMDNAELVNGIALETKPTISSTTYSTSGVTGSTSTPTATTVTTTTLSPFLVISDKNVSMIDYEKRAHIVKVSTFTYFPLQYVGHLTKEINGGFIASRVLL